MKHLWCRVALAVGFTVSIAAQPADREIGVFSSSLTVPARVQTQEFLGANGDLWLSSPPVGDSTGILLRSFTSSMTFTTNAVQRMKIFANGNVAIGLMLDQNSALFSYGVADNGRAVLAMQRSSVEATTAGGQNDTGAEIHSINDISAGVVNNGSVTGVAAYGRNYGPGTLYAAIGGRFVAGNSEGVPASTGTVVAVGIQAEVRAPVGVVATGYGVYVVDTQATTDYGVYQAGANDDNYFAGTVGIGTATPMAGKKLHVVGDAHFDGTVTGTNIHAKYQDVAEWVPAAEDLAPGTVVIVDRRTENTVTASTKAYDTSVAGVVSAAPGVILGEAHATKEKIATTGRVRVRVDASSGPIEIGDLLVTSHAAGMAMKSQPVDFGGDVVMHRPGTILGKALEPLDHGTGEILVLLSLQ